MNLDSSSKEINLDINVMKTPQNKVFKMPEEIYNSNNKKLSRDLS